MKLKFTCLFLLVVLCAHSQLLTTNPEFIQESSNPVEIIVDATKGNQGLKDYTPETDVYVHIGVITSKSTSSADWKYVKFSSFNSPSPTVQATFLGNNKWKYTITGGLRSFFGITDATETIKKLALLFRNGNGSKVQRNTDGSDMYLPVYDGSVAVKITNPITQPKYTPVPEPMTVAVGDGVPVTAKSNQPATLKLYMNGTQFGSTATNATTISGNAVIAASGNQTIVAEASNAGITRYDTIHFVATNSTVTEPLPAGLKDGINYEPAGTAATLVLIAPGKSNIAVIGEFNGWSPTTPYQMKKTPDGQRFWLRLTGLTPGTEYAYQYLIDGTLKVADYNTEKILDPSNDQYIPAANYPNLKAYPTGFTTGIVSVLQPGKAQYVWQVPNFNKPDKRNLLIYELLVRDFVAAQNWQTLRDTLSYIKRLGINAIEVMPFNEFEGNNSWGYNPDFYFAPDKMYGTETALRQFIDECHKQGIAVIMDIVLNHTFGPSPLARMYWDAQNNRPASNNPFYNSVQPHAFGFGDDFNHESTYTKDFFNRVLQHWITQYKVDGYRFDFSKGLTQRASTNDATFSAYDASRIAIIKGYANNIRSVDTSAYLILEHFCENTEEKELADNGMLLWGNLNYNFNEATMGYLGNSNFQNGIYTSRGWSQPNLVTYQESHDEERLMFKNEQYGNSTATYNVKDLNTGLARSGMAAAFWAMTPAPKMMWQFEELGYDYSINRCEDGTISNDCRLSPKPLAWNYKANPNRQALYNVYSKLLRLRNVPNFLPTFVTNNIAYNLSGGFKTMQVSSDSLKITVIGNFDVQPATGTVTFPNSGTWYDYLNGTTKTATGSAETITLNPGEYYVYTNRNANPLVAALPLKLLSFQGSRTSNNISLNWKTTNEVNVKEFIVERSLNGSAFSAVGKKAANNTARESLYNWVDADPAVLKSNSSLYYRLKIMDADGNYSYSNIVIISAVKGKSHISVYPNPVSAASAIEYDLQESGNVSISVLNMQGQKVKILFSGFQQKGFQRLPIKNLSNLKTLATGTYLLKVETNGMVDVQQFIIQK